jgi:hypothetical protein
MCVVHVNILVVIKLMYLFYFEEGVVVRGGKIYMAANKAL